MSLPRYITVILTGIIVFIAAMTAGLAMARHKPLWLDELYSQESSIERLSWGQIWAGKAPEGNNSPLFYTIQKALSAALHCQGRDLWHNDDKESRVVLRILPVFFMSLGIALIVAYFTALEGIAGALLGIVVSITSYMVWGYWAEARPYAMVFFGTALQGIALNHFFRNGDTPRRFGLIVITHWFLALTSALSVIQIAAASCVLWISGRKRFRNILVYAIIPLAIGFTYRAMTLQHRIWFPPDESVASLFLFNISAGRLKAIAIFSVTIWLLWKIMTRPVQEGFGKIIAWSGLTLLGYVVLVGYMKTNACAEAQGCAPVSNRYFMTLTPLGIMIMLTSFFALLRQAREGWMKWTAWAMILFFTLPRLKKAWSWAAAHHLFDFLSKTTGISP